MTLLHFHFIQKSSPQSLQVTVRGSFSSQSNPVSQDVSQSPVDWSSEKLDDREEGLQLSEGRGVGAKLLGEVLCKRNDIILSDDKQRDAGFGLKVTPVMDAFTVDGHNSLAKSEISYF